jgi:4-diphosphocytidyl-2-C-methyl-D-erythritol kinase
MATTYRSFAKINLHLEVVGRRPDGYHELRTVFQTVSLHDLIEVSLAGPGVELALRGRRVAAGESNLAHRAAVAFLERWGGGRGVRLVLDKRIPVEGGLGGGSSNAATVLLALRELIGSPADEADLVEVAAGLGADVPYFLLGGTALGTGRGDVVEPLPDLGEDDLWLFDPGQGVSTRRVFESGLIEPRTAPDPLLDALRRGAVRGASGAVGANDLEPAVFAVSAAVREVYNSLVSIGMKRIRVSGSGSTLFAFRSGAEDEREALSILPGDVRVFRVRTMSRASFSARRAVNSLGGP